MLLLIDNLDLIYMNELNMDILKQMPFLIFRKEVIKKHHKILTKYKNIDNLYLNILSSYLGVCINSDVNLLDYEKAILKNNHIESDYFEISNEFWLFADNSQGDEWFLHKISNIVYYYNHDNGEYQINEFESLNISFMQFLQFSLLCRELEELENFSFQLSDKDKSEFIIKANKIHEHILEYYPYSLW